MRRLVFLLLPFCLPTLLIGQDLSGKWRGYFTPSNDLEGKVVTYEMVIKEAADHTLIANTYSKISNNFTAIAIATGIHSENIGLVSITETRFDKMKLIGNYQACLMSNFLNYRLIRGREILEGTYTANNETLGKDCGGGKVYLEKEGPIVKIFDKAPENKIEPTIAFRKSTIRATLLSSNAFSKTAANLNNPNTVAKKVNDNLAPKTNNEKSALSSLTAAASNNTITNKTTTTNTAITGSVAPASNINSTSLLNNDPNNNEANATASKPSGTLQILPWVLVGRENKLFKQVIVANPNISIDLYDNGTIDNDTIMIYDNKQLLLSNKRLSYKATHFDVSFSKDNNQHEIIIVAQNLGTVPPNTALMVLKDGNSRQEIFITSTLSTNAMIIIEYKKLIP